MTSDGTHTYTYDDEGRIISVDNGGTGTYVYEADGLRVHRAGSEGPEDYVYDLADHAVATILPSCVGPLDPTPIHFTGKLRDPETGLDYSNARYYSSNAGCFMLPDWRVVHSSPRRPPLA